MDPFLFYRDFDAANPATSGAKHLSAAASRFALSISYSILEMPEAVWLEFRELLTVETLWALCIVLAAWLVGVIVGGPIAVAINGLLIAYGLWELWGTVKLIWEDFSLWGQTAYFATTEQELRRSAAYFASALSKGGLALLQALVTHRVFKATSGRLREKFPTPEWLRKLHEEARVKRGARPEETAARRKISAEEAERKRRSSDDPDRPAARANLSERLSTASSAAVLPAAKGLGGAGVAAVVGTVAAVAVGGTVVGALLMRKKRG